MESQLRVQLPIFYEVATETSPKESLREKAQKNLRCLDASVTKSFYNELISKKITEFPFYPVPTAVGIGEPIHYFKEWSKGRSNTNKFKKEYQQWQASRAC